MSRSPRHPVHYGAAFFAIAAAGLCVAALITTEWYNISAPGTLTANYGLYRSCVNGGCGQTTFSDFSGTCQRKGSDMKTRTYAVFGLVIGGGALALFSSLLVFNSPSRRALCFLSAICAFLSMGSLCAASALYPFTWHHWYYCDQTYCVNGFTGTGSCEAFFGYSFALAIIAAASMVVAVALNVVNLCRYLPAAAAAEKHSVPVTEGDAERQGVSEHAQHDMHTDELPAAATAVPDARHDERPRRASRSPQLDRGSASVAENRRTTEMRALTSSTNNNQSLDGWELDENTGLYWSDREKLFYDPISGHFYDPESELWYDPSTEQWYQGAEQ
jgi:hypothetical protein